MKNWLIILTPSSYISYTYNVNKNVKITTTEKHNNNTSVILIILENKQIHINYFDKLIFYSTKESRWVRGKRCNIIDKNVFKISLQRGTIDWRFEGYFTIIFTRMMN